MSGRLDILTEAGVRLRRPIPTGEALVTWLIDKKGMPEFCDALRAEEQTPFSWEEIAIGIHQLTREAWSPSAAYVQALYRQQGGAGSSGLDHHSELGEVSALR